MNIAIFFGGKTSEHEVSLRSASAVVRNIDTTKHHVFLIGITKDGRMFLQSATEVERIKNDENAVLTIKTSPDMVIGIIPGGGTEGGLVKLGSEFGAKNLPVDVVFAVLHGTYGEDGTVQGMLEMADIPYVGGGVMASAVSMDKEKTKQIWHHAGLPVVPFVCIRRFEFDDKDFFAQTVKKIEKDFSYPVFVKPCSAGSSVGANKAENFEELNKALQDAFLWDYKVLVEPFISAREIECSVTGNDAVVAYTPGEIVPNHEFYDYEAKYTDPNGAALLIPADLDDGALKTVRELAIKAYRALDLSGLSRIDFFIDKKSGALFLNEVNTIPGFTSISMFAKMCAASGLPYAQLIENLLQLAIEQANARKKLKTSR